MLYSIYIRYIRYRIGKIDTIKDLISIFKNISLVYKNVTTDKICEIFIDSFTKYPLSELELQKISLLEQSYISNLGIESYATCILWLCVIQSIQETELIKIKNKHQVTNDNEFKNTNPDKFIKIKIKFKRFKNHIPFFFVNPTNPNGVRLYISFLMGDFF